MLQHVERDDRIDAVRPDGERQQVGGDQRERGIHGARCDEHRGREVSTDGESASGGEVPNDVRGPATDVECDPTGAAVRGDRVEDAAVERELVEVATEWDCREFG